MQWLDTPFIKEEDKESPRFGDEKRYREHEVIDNDVEQSLQVDINDFVLAVYAFNRKAYIEKVIDIDAADSEVFVSFMEASTADGSADGSLALMNAQP